MGFFSDLRAVVNSSPCPPFAGEDIVDLGFPIHPSTSELAENLLVDPEALKLETYEPGIYDESGDYYPQFTDDPSALPEAFEPAPLNVGGDTAPESLPASDSQFSDSSETSVSDKSE